MSKGGGMYFIIWGSRGITSSVEEGDFYCPRCDTPRHYDHKRVRKFFTLYFIPLIPMKTVGEYVECSVCNGTFELDILEYDPTVHRQQFEAEFEKAMKKIMVLMMLADGEVDDDEISVIQGIFQKISGRELSSREVSTEVTAAQNDARDITEFTETLVGSLNDSGKEMVVKAAFMVAAADGVFQEEEKDMLHEIGESLQMTPAHFSGMIQSMSQS